MPRLETRKCAVVEREGALVRAADVVAVALVDLADVDLGRQVADAGGGVVAVGDVDDADGAAAGAVVAGEDAEDFGRAGDGARLHEGGRAEHAVAEEAGQAGAVRVDGPEALDRDGGLVHVFPARVDDAAIVQHARGEIVHDVGREPGHARAVALHAMQDADRRHPAIGEARRAGGEEGDAAVGQPAGVVVVVRAVGELAQLRAVGVDRRTPGNPPVACAAN